MLEATTLYAKWTLNNSSYNGDVNTPTTPLSTVPPEDPPVLPAPTPKPFYNEMVNIDVIKALIEKANAALTPEGDSSFKDTEGHWAADAIATLKASGIINGYLDGTFKPNQSISRAEIVAMLAKVMYTTLVEEVKFKDVSGNWAEAEINTLSDMGIIKGTSDGSFEPNATRSESLLMILRMLNVSLGFSLEVE